MGPTMFGRRSKGSNGRDGTDNFLVDGEAGCPLLPHGVRHSPGLELGRGMGVYWLKRQG